VRLQVDALETEDYQVMPDRIVDLKVCSNGRLTLEDTLVKTITPDDALLAQVDVQQPSRQKLRGQAVE
jgi:hypothetical protein